jgi:DNA-binding NarL/FixJ family response regulator
MSATDPNEEGSIHRDQPLELRADSARLVAHGVGGVSPRTAPPARVHRICGTGAFSDLVARVLRRIDAGCAVELRAHGETDASAGAQPTLILIDVDAAPGTHGALVERARHRNPDSAIVALSSALDHAAIDRALRAGATGYLPKHYTEPLVEGVLRLVIGGERFRPEARHHGAARRARRATPGAVASDRYDSAFGLTGREVEVLAQVAQGCSNLEVGKRLGMQEATVKRHVYNIFGKLNVSNRAAAALVGARLAAVQHTQMREAERGRLNLAWLRPEMSHRRMRAGQTIFRAGDQGNALYCLQRGSVRLPEIDATVEPGEVFGEIGIFTPEHQRTCSALCETDVDLFTLDSDHVKRIYFANPQFAFFILHLVATRLMADRHRRRGEPS